MKLLFNILFLFLCQLAAAQGIDGRTLFYDRLTDTYLCTVPEAWFDDGRVDNFTCDTATVRFTFLPVVHLQGDFGYDYVEGTVSVVMPDDASSQKNMTARVKWRGGSTNTADKHKRNYSLKFVDAGGKKQDRKFFSLRNDNHWILDAAQVDLSRIRNRVATDLWNDFAAKPYYFDREPKAKTGTRGQFVEVFLNDEYRGIYCMTECMDRSQMKLKKYTDNADGTQTIHGQLWKTSNFRFTAFGEYEDYDNESETWGGFETKYPDIEDVCPTDYSLIYKIVKFSTDATDSEFEAEAAKYFDLKPTADYVLMMHLLNAIDNNSKNTYWACYDSKATEMITPGVWDLDVTVGQYFDPNDCHSDIVAADSVYEIGNWAFFRLDSLNVGGFHDYLSSRYQELRQTLFHPDSLTERYHSYMRMLTKCGAYEREAERWSGDSDIGGQTLDFAGEAEFIEQWIHRRIKVLDAHEYVTNGIRGVSIAPDPNDETMYSISGQRVGSGYRGIVIRGGKKVLL